MYVYHFESINRVKYCKPVVVNEQETAQYSGHLSNKFLYMISLSLQHSRSENSSLNFQKRQPQKINST